MKSKYVKRFSTPENKIYLFIILILIIVVLKYEWKIAIVGMGFFIYLLYYNWKTSYRRRTEWVRYIEGLSEDIDTAARTSFFKVPIPLTVLEEDGSISWYNTHFSDLFEQEEEILGQFIHDYVAELSPKKIMETGGTVSKQIFFKGHYYQVLCYYVTLKTNKLKTKKIINLYWINVTDYVNLKERYEQEKTICCLIQVDNYDEVFQNTEEINRPAVLAEIDRRIGQWVNALKAGWRKYDEDKYIVYFANTYFKMQEEKKFDLLDDIRNIKAGNSIPVTLCIGVGVGGQDLAESTLFATTAIDFGLGRGGDQAVVKNRDKLIFYGGKTKTVEKRTKVKSRVIAHSFRELIQHSNRVYIMGHELPDLDSLGSALGVYRGVKTFEKEVFIVLGDSNASIDILLKELKSKPEYSKVFISCEQALSSSDEADLLIIVDTQKPSFTECPELIKKIRTLFVIDHHRRSAESIVNPTLSFLEPYASSTSELMTEILQYMDEGLKLNPIEAEALLAGIAVDTKHFYINTGVRTFEAAAYLKRAGADTTTIRRFFEDDIETFTSRADIVKNAEIYKENIAISICPSNVKNAPLLVAQAADALISIKGISASFVLYGNEQGVIISGRSLGDINVQLILEELGGGGHLSIAGARLKDITLEDAKKKVKDVIEKYLEEEEK